MLTGCMLRSPTEQYKPWFSMVLKSARLAVHVLSMLTEEACPLSCLLAVLRA